MHHQSHENYSHEEILEAYVRRRCREFGVSETITPYVLDELTRLHEAKAVTTIKPGGGGIGRKRREVKLRQQSSTFARSQKAHARAASKSLDKTVDEFGDFIVKLIGQYQSNKIAYRRMLTRAQIAFKGQVEQVFKLGMKSVGLVKPTGSLYDLTDNEKKWIRSYVLEEFGYFRKFLDDVKRGATQKVIKRRAFLYASALRSVYESARVLSVGSDVLITWTLESDDPCPDCRELARHNPYTTQNLPTTPKAGTTRCLSNCYCTLRIDKATPAKVAANNKRHVKKDYLLRKIKASRNKSKTRA